MHRAPALALTLLALAGGAAASHDESVGARFVQPGGVDAGNCLDHHAPCVSMQYALAQAEPGNTLKVGAGIFDLRGVDPETFLHGPVHASGGYGDADHYYESRPLEVQSIVTGVDARYRNALAVRGFYWAESVAAAQRNEFSLAGGTALQAPAVAPAECTQGLAGQFPCRNISFQSQVSLAQFSSRPVSAANVWGFVDLNDNREYAVLGLRNGTAIVEVTDPANPREVCGGPCVRAEQRLGLVEMGQAPVRIPFEHLLTRQCQPGVRVRRIDLERALVERGRLRGAASAVRVEPGQHEAQRGAPRRISATKPGQPQRFRGGRRRAGQLLAARREQRRTEQGGERSELPAVSVEPCVEDPLHQVGRPRSSTRQGSAQPGQVMVGPVPGRKYSARRAGQPASARAPLLGSISICSTSGGRRKAPRTVPPVASRRKRPQIGSAIALEASPRLRGSSKPTQTTATISGV
jgi:hypothetical protein